MKEYVLDTHALVMWLTRAARLGKAAKRAVREVDTGRALAFVPCAVAIELTLLGEARRKVPGVGAVAMAMKANDGLRVLPQDFDQAREFALLAVLKDPFDRMIVAAARTTRRPLITSDGIIADSGLVEVIWD